MIPVKEVNPKPAPALRARPVREVRGYVYAWAALIAIAVVRLWILPLRTGFWLDETGTFWAASGTFKEVFSRCLLWPSQFPLYTAIAWMALHLGGRAELMMRLPSILATAIAAYLVYRIGIRMVNRTAGLAAALVFVSFEPVAFAAGDARSYAIGLCAVVGAMLALVRWMESGRLAYGLVYAGCAALTWHMHYVFATTFIVHVVYVLWSAKEGRRLRAMHVAAVIGAAVILTLPSVPHLQAMLRTATSHGFAGSPSVADLFAMLAPPALLCGLLAAVAIQASGGRVLRLAAVEREHWLLLGLWLLIPCVIPFGISMVSNAKIFLPRYVLPVFPALALIAGIVIASFPTRFALFAGAITLGALVFSAEGPFDFSHGGDWSKAVQSVNRLAGGAPVLFRSGFPESEPYNWLSDPARRDFLLAPLRIYPAPGSVVPLPFHFDTQARAKVEQLAPWLASHNRFLMVEMGDRSYDLWLAGRLSSAGFSSRVISGFGGPQDSLRLVVFEKHG